MNFYYNTKLITNADVFPYIKGIHLKSFPLPNVSNEYIQRIEQRVLQLQTALCKGNDDVEVKIVYMERIPICEINRDKQSALSSLVRKVLEEDVGDGSFRILIERIDFLVYHLYGLTYDEVLVVDPDTPITREEYEAYKGE